MPCLKKPPLARLSGEDQLFLIAFVKSDGSIKEMERIFGISYPTVKNRLNRIAAQLDYVEINPPPSAMELLGRLEKGEIQLMGDPPPGADWARISADPAWKDRIERHPSLAVLLIGEQ